MNTNTKGILGLIAVAAGAFGLWKYKNMTPEQKANLKEKAQKAGDTLKDTYNEVEDQVSEKLTQLREALEKETNTLKRNFDRKSDEMENTIEVEAEKVENKTAELV